MNVANNLVVGVIAVSALSCGLLSSQSALAVNWDGYSNVSKGYSFKYYKKGRKASRIRVSGGESFDVRSRYRSVNSRRTIPDVRVYVRKKNEYPDGNYNR